MRVSVFGVGYVGLVQAAVLASVGHEVVCVDVDEKKVNNLKKGIIPIYEPGLSNLVNENFKSGRLEFTIDAELAVEHGLLQFIAVGTPPSEDGSADLKFVLNVAETIARYMQEPKVIISKSTVPVGTADKIKARVSEVLGERDIDLQFDVVSNPEFLKEGAAVSDCLRPDRIILGTDNNDSIKLMRELYAPFSRNHEKIIVMDVRSAEMTKYAANCMLATKISFMNEMSNLAEKLGADIEAVRNGIGSDPRIGYQFIYPGCGYGGSCFPKDMQALIKTAYQVGYRPKILEAVEAVNEHQKTKLFEYLSEHFNNIQGKVIAIWGLSFKPNTDDMREASSRTLIEQLWKSGAVVRAFDPQAMEECQRIYGQREDLILCGTKEAAVQQADALVICTEWNQFRAPDFELIGRSLNNKVIIDGRNLFEPQTLIDKGFSYYGIGRGESVES